MLDLCGCVNECVLPACKNVMHVSCMCGCMCGWVNTLDTQNSLYHRLTPRDAQNSVIEQRTQTHSCTVLLAALNHCQLNPKPDTLAWNSMQSGKAD